MKGWRDEPSVPVRCPSGFPITRSFCAAWCDECKGESGPWYDGDPPKPIKHKPGCSRA